MKKYYTFAQGKTKNFSGEGGKFPSSLKSKKLLFNKP
jgi:hypothetical protein